MRRFSRQVVDFTGIFFNVEQTLLDLQVTGRQTF